MRVTVMLDIGYDFYYEKERVKRTYVFIETVEPGSSLPVVGDYVMTPLGLMPVEARYWMWNAVEVTLHLVRISRKRVALPEESVAEKEDSDRSLRSWREGDRTRMLGANWIALQNDLTRGDIVLGQWWRQP